MQLYFAPLEGVTGYAFRRAHMRYFAPADKYFAPFYSPTREHVLPPRAARELDPVRNEGVSLVPQLLCRDPGDFIWAAKLLADMGYGEVNLNLGCPSGTVAAKGKGSGFLAFPEELEAFLCETGESAYRARQVFEWVHKKDVADFAQMTDLPLSLREKLARTAFVTAASVEKKLVSARDGTVKFLFGFDDGEKVESVLMRYKHGNTVCISTQAGCRMGCAFCASTLNGLKRNLTPAEMLEQVMAAQRHTGEKVSNIVLMGIGEPLDNYDNVIKFLKLVNHKSGMNIGLRHVSLSTCGLVDRIDRLAGEGLPVTLSVSLHAPNDDIRRRIMPVANRYSIDELLDCCRRYEKRTGRRTSFEYALIRGVNDSPACAHELGSRLRGSLCHVNLIPVNEVKGKIYKRSEKVAIELFTKALESYRMTVTVRRSLGGDINASCGQLRAEHSQG